jgi:hypothetical protein
MLPTTIYCCGPPVPERPFHHGNLRVVLLAGADQTARDPGEDALSLRQLARQSGVAHLIDDTTMVFTGKRVKV